VTEYEGAGAPNTATERSPEPDTETQGTRTYYAATDIAEGLLRELKS
jgi:hypothetical protein